MMTKRDHKAEYRRRKELRLERAHRELSGKALEWDRAFTDEWTRHLDDNRWFGSPLTGGNNG